MTLPSTSPTERIDRCRPKDQGTSGPLPPFTPHPEGRLIPVEQALHLDASELAWSGSLDGTAPMDSWLWVELTERAQSLHRRGWTPEAVEVASYSVEPTGEHTVSLTMRIAVTRFGRDAFALEELDLTSRPCHYGGVRWHFECRYCGRLRARMYRMWTWACRRCFDLTYESRQKYNRASRHATGGRRRMWYVLDRLEVLAARRRRKNWRRRVSRWKAQEIPV